MSLLINGLSMLLVSVGTIFFLGAAVGLVRLPDFYTRMHAAGKGDTLSTILILAGLALFTLNSVSFEHFALSQLLVPVKILAIAVFIMLTSPTSTHALMQAGFDDDIKPFTKKESQGSKDGTASQDHESTGGSGSPSV